MIIIGIFISSFLLTELFAGLCHKYLMHGPLWKWHEDHHAPYSKEKLFQKNDRFFLVFAIPSMILGMTSYLTQNPLFLAASMGLAVYGLVYFIVHDVYIHQRFKLFQVIENPYFRYIKKMHAIHHGVKKKEGSSRFGLLFPFF